MDNSTEYADLDRRQKIINLSKDILQAREQEDLNKLWRVQLERDLLDLIQTKQEGTTTTTAGPVTVSVTGKITRKVDLALFREISDELPPSYKNVVEIAQTGKLDLKTMRSMREHDRDAFGIFARCLTETPARPQIKIKLDKE